MHASSPLLNLPGAVEAEGTGVANHYGHPLAESRALSEGRAFVDVSNEGVLKLTGPDRLSWLNSITSQDLTHLMPDLSTETLVLSPQGRIEYSAGVVDDGEATWLFVDINALAGLQAFLLKMRFMLRVEIVDVTADFAQIFTLSNDVIATIAERAPITATWADPWGEILPGGYQYADRENYDWQAKRILIARDQLVELSKLVRQGQLGVAGLSSLEALEVRAWRPTMSDVDDRTIPHELDWMRTAVHLNKGCYRGQETVAKVHNLGRPPRRFVMLHIDGADAEMPAAGALISLADDDSKAVGRITRVAMHHDWGTIALAMVKRNTSPDALLKIELPSGGSCTAVQEVIVPPDAGATKDVPRLPRLQ